MEAPTREGPRVAESGKIVDNVEIEEKSKPPGRLKGIAAKLWLHKATLLLMLKGSLPPTIGIAMYQATAVSDTFTTIGYLIPIVSIFGMAILPRGKFLQLLALNLLAVCIGCAMALLTLWSSIQARQHTSSPPPRTPGSAPTSTSPPAPAFPPYNASQSTVCALWLIFHIWAANLLRATRPSFNLPVIVYCITTSIATTYGPLLTSTAQTRALVRELLVALLVALALAAGVSLLVLPVSSRDVVRAQLAGATELLRRALVLQRGYLLEMERGEGGGLGVVETAVEGGGGEAGGKRKAGWWRRKRGGADPELSKEAELAAELKSVITELRALAVKVTAEIKFAKRETAWGKLDAGDLKDMFALFQRIFIPIVGLSTSLDVFRRAASDRGRDQADGEKASVEEVAMQEAETRVWNEVLKQLHEPFRTLSEAIDQGLEHAAIRLELTPRPRRKAAPAEADVEAQGETVRPGDDGFSKTIDEKVKSSYRSRSEALRVWTRERASLKQHITSKARSDELGIIEVRRQHDLFVLLYMEQLMHAAGEAVQDLVDFAEKRVEDGTMAKNRIIFPTGRRLWRWVVSVFNDKDTHGSDSADVFEQGTNLVYLGDGFGGKKDPEHLPPTNAWQRFGDGIRGVSRVVGSEESMFGLRCACATMTVAIVCYLEATQIFFQEQRLVWAMIIIAIGMTQTTGQSIFGLFCRVAGTIAAMMFCYIIWYVVDEKAPGVIVLLWLSLFGHYYLLLKFPRFIPASMINLVTQVLIIGYELQVRQIGIARAEAMGQQWYPTYRLAAYRVAVVAGGCLVAFIWTIFPRPTTERAWLRRELGATLYLLANYFSAINETMKAARHARLGAADVPGTPASRLLHVRQKLVTQLMAVLPALQAHAQWQRWEPNVGGRFPKAAYDDILLRANRILNYLSLISYTVTWTPRQAAPAPAPVAADDGRWLAGLAELLAEIGPAHESVLSALTLLSSALLSGQALPPYVPIPRPDELTRRLLDLRNPYEEDAGRREAGTGAAGGFVAGGGPSILDERNVEERGYTEFAVLQVCSTLICDDLEGLLRAVSGLVGAVDFSFRLDVGQLDGEGVKGGDEKGKQD